MVVLRRILLPLNGYGDVMLINLKVLKRGLEKKDLRPVWEVHFKPI